MTTESTEVEDAPDGEDGNFLLALDESPAGAFEEFVRRLAALRPLAG